MFKKLTQKEIADFQDFVNQNKDKCVFNGVKIELCHPVIRHQLGLWLLSESFAYMTYLAEPKHETNK